jgi:hypothetical protein
MNQKKLIHEDSTCKSVLEASEEDSTYKSPLITLGTLEASQDDSTCKSLLVELKVLPILKTCCGLGIDTLGTYINFALFQQKLSPS